MDNPTARSRILPPTADASLIAHLREIHNATWPARLRRFTPFALTGEPNDKAYVAVAWQPSARMLHVQPITLDEPPPKCRMPIPIQVDQEDWLSRVKPVQKPLKPPCMRPPIAEVQASMLEGTDRRMMLLNALLMIDPAGLGREDDYIINDYIFWDAQIRSERIKQMRQELGAGAGFRAYLLNLFTKCMRYGGGRKSMLALTPFQGGPGKPRLSPAEKPGALSTAEQLKRSKAYAKGNAEPKRGKRVDQTDIDFMTDSLTTEWAGNKTSLMRAYRLMCETHYAKAKPEQIPSYGRFWYRHKQIVQEKGLLQKRFGRVATEQYFEPRTGSSSDITQGVLEILDVDGFRPKIPIGAVVNGKMVPMEVTIIFGVSRLSGGVRGYEISLNREKGEGYRRCLISAILPMDDRATSLGLGPLPGLLSGNIDGVFVDNGPGKAKDVRSVVNEDLGGIMLNPPGARGDLKAIGERLNRTMIHIMAEETEEGHTRDKSLLEKIKRRIRRNAKPIALDDFERLLLKTINHVNMTANKRKLRSAVMRRANVGITAASIHQYYQSSRRGQAARAWTERELYDALIPWKEKVCSKGLVKFADASYTSNELVALSSEWAKLPGKNPPLKVGVKRTTQLSQSLLCKDHDENVFEIEMIEEDKRRFGLLSWKAHEFARIDELVREDELKKKRAKSSGTLKARRQEEIDSIEYGRGNAYAGASGATVTQAKQNGNAWRDAELAERQRAAYGVSPPSAGDAAQVNAANVPFEDASDDLLAAAARKAEEAYRRASR